MLPAVAALCLLGVVVLATTASGASSGPPKYNELPDPLARGKYTPKRTDPVKFGLATLQEPNGKGTAATGANESITLQVRGSMYQPEGYSGKSPLILFVHGNHSECDLGTAPNCTIFKRNDEGYNYMSENLASWGYTVVSLDQDQLMSRQDSSYGKGMHARRLLILAMLTKIKEASETAQTVTENSNVGELLTGKVDMTRIGLMGHSRGGDAVASFALYDQTLPKGERFPLRAVVSIAPVDYERHAPTGMPYMTVFGSCDGDVSNLQGARLYERGQYDGNQKYPRYQVIQVGANHDAYNTVWMADGDDASAADVACGPDAKGGVGTINKTSLVESNTPGTLTTADPDSIRLSGEAGEHFEAVTGETKPYRWGNGTTSTEHPEGESKLNPEVNTRISGNPALMGDQEKMGLATVASFLRRYVGGEGAFEPYLTGELAAEGEPSIPQSACPTSEAGRRIPCIDRVADSYTAPEGERMDVLRPDTEHPTTMDALGTKIEAKGFANPYQASGAVQPVPALTSNGISWCDPDPEQTEPTLLSEGTYPTAAKWCPQPAKETLGGQGTYKPANTTESASAAPREQAPVNGSYGRQLSLAWEGKADLGIDIPATDGNVSDYRALYMATAVNFFDTRNPARGTEGQWNPEAAPQNWIIAVKDAEGNEATVEADDADFGTATQQTLGSTSDRVHVILRDLRVPLKEFEEQGVNLSELRKLELRFGGDGMPKSGSIQLADVSFEQPSSGYSNVFLETTEGTGPGTTGITSGPNPAEEFESGTYKRADGEYEIPNVTKQAGADVWTVDDDKVQCPNAEFTHIQEAVEYASPWDTIVVCPGTYEESSTPINSTPNPVATGAVNGLTIKKPLKIIGAGASKVTIKPAASLTTLAGATPDLRDGGGNVITASRQSLGSTEYDEDFVDISGVTIETGSTSAEAGVAFFNSSGRIADSVIKGANWGVVETNSLIGSGSGAAERQVTIEDSTVEGYATGGVLFDGSKGGIDGAATNTEQSGMNQTGYVIGSTIEGNGGSSALSQTGIAYRSGAHGEIKDSAVVKNLSGEGSAKSFGILAADSGALSITGSKIAMNGSPGYGVYDANATVTGVGTQAITATNDYWGTGSNPVEAETILGPPDREGVGGPVTTTPVAATAPVIPAVPTVMPDADPVGELVTPTTGEAAEVGVTAEPVVFAEDDYGVKSVSLTADGVPVETIGEAPYQFSWKPTLAEKGSSVELEATITDSSGQVTTSTVTVPVVGATTAEGELAEEKEEKAKVETQKEQAETEKAEAEVRLTEAEAKKAEAETKAAEAKTEAEAAEAATAMAEAETAEAEAATAIAEAEKAEAIAVAEEELATAKAASEAAAKAASEAAAVNAKAAEEKADAALKAAEAKAAQAEKELAEAKAAAATTPTAKATKVIKNTTKGTARLGVTVSEPGSLTITGPGIVKVSGHPTGPGEVQVLIKAKGGALKTLDKTGKVSVKVTITFTAGGKTTTKTTTVALVKK